MMISVISLYVLILLIVLLKIAWKPKPKRKLVNEVGVPEELLKYIYPAVDLLGLKGTVTIIKYKKKKGEAIVTDGNLNFTIGGLKEDIKV